MKIEITRKETSAEEKLMQPAEYDEQLEKLGEDVDATILWDRVKDIYPPVKKAIRDEENFIIIGNTGWGKTETVEKAAAEAGHRCTPLTLATKMPEDLQGIARIKEIVRPNKNNKETFDYLAPQWVIDIIVAWEDNGVRTVLFLDEINQGTYEVMNSVFQLVNKRVFGDNKNYIMKEAIACVGAAGNWPSENKGTNEVSPALLRRFPIKLIAPTDWNIAKIYLREGFPHLADFITPINWTPAINPATAASILRRLDKWINRGYNVIEEVSTASSIHPIIKDQLLKVWSTTKLNSGTVNTAPNTGLNMGSQGADYAIKTKIRGLVKEIQGKRRHTFPDGTTIFPLTEGKAEVVKELQSQYKNEKTLDEEFWHSLLDGAK